jgi:hypothetical protein
MLWGLNFGHGLLLPRLIWGTPVFNRLALLMCRSHIQPSEDLALRVHMGRRELPIPLSSGGP